MYQRPHCCYIIYADRDFIRIIDPSNELWEQINLTIIIPFYGWRNINLKSTQASPQPLPPAMKHVYHNNHLDF